MSLHREENGSPGQIESLMLVESKRLETSGSADGGKGERKFIHINHSRIIRYPELQTNRQKRQAVICHFSPAWFSHCWGLLGSKTQ